MMNARRKSGFTCSGVALVAMSKSFGVESQQQVAHGAADDERLEAALLQLVGDHARAARNLLAANRMLVARVDLRVTLRPAGHQAGEQAADHRRGLSLWGARNGRAAPRAA